MVLITGMLLAGFALANIPGINVAININNQLSSSLRSIALAIILVKAGLDLDSEVKFSKVLINYYRKFKDNK